MLDIVQNALNVPGIIWVFIASVLAGVVRGFSGFGSAMIFLPVAGSVFSPVTAVSVLIFMDIIGPAFMAPRMWQDARRDEFFKLVIGMLVCMPLATFLLTSLSPHLFRYLVSIVSLILLVLLILGVRYRGVLKNWMLYGAGALGGIFGGVAGVPGPPVIMVYMASTSPPKVIRANNSLFLVVFDVALLAVFALRGLLTINAVIIGLIIAVPYLLGNMLGQRIFNPEKERTYRMIAYVIIALSALRGLPIWE